jgi:hypothetical protein
LFPGDVAWIDCSHTVSTFFAVLFRYTSAYEFYKDIEHPLKHLHETRIGKSSMCMGSIIIFRKNEEAWRGKISDMGTLRNGKIFYFVEDAVSDSGKIHSFDVEGKDIIKGITDLEIEHGFYG